MSPPCRFWYLAVGSALGLGEVTIDWKGERCAGQMRIDSEIRSLLFESSKDFPGAVSVLVREATNSTVAGITRDMHFTAGSWAMASNTDPVSFAWSKSFGVTVRLGDGSNLVNLGSGGDCSPVTLDVADDALVALQPSDGDWTTVLFEGAIRLDAGSDQRVIRSTAKDRESGTDCFSFDWCDDEMWVLVEAKGSDVCRPDAVACAAAAPVRVRPNAHRFVCTANSTRLVTAGWGPVVKHENNFRFARVALISLGVLFVLFGIVQLVLWTFAIFDFGLA